jgi:hypothetical protein
MMNVASSLVRRGFEAHASFVKNGGDEKPLLKLPAWAIAVLTATFLIYAGVMFSIEYTFGRLVPTLLMIESPAEAITFEPIPTSDPDSTIKTPELQVVKPQPITASFRRSLKHLSAVGGFRARFRGFAVFLTTAIAVQWIAGMVSALPFVPRMLSNIIAVVACAQLKLAWTHIVISEPSPKTWFRRMPPLKMWKKVALPTFHLALAENITIFVPIYIAMIAGVTKSADELTRMTPHEKSIMMLKGFFISMFGLVLAFVLIIPANVVLTRVQASLLPDSEETIVPFDRSFGGKVEPEIVGGSGVLGMVDAWKTFDWAGRVRLVKAYAKVFGMQIGASLLFTGIIAAQLFIIVGNNWSRLMPNDGNNN